VKIYCKDDFDEVIHTDNSEKSPDKVRKGSFGDILMHCKNHPQYKNSILASVNAGIKGGMKTRQK